MSNKVTPQRVEEIRRYSKGWTISDETNVKYVYDLLAYIDQNCAAPAPEVETVGWMWEYRGDTHFKQTRPLDYSMPCDALVRRSDMETALAAKEDRVRVLEDVVIQLRCQKAGDKLVIGTRGDRIAKFKDEIADLRSENAKLRGVVEAVRVHVASTPIHYLNLELCEILTGLPKGTSPEQFRAALSKGGV